MEGVLMRMNQGRMAIAFGTALLVMVVLGIPCHASESIRQSLKHPIGKGHTG